MPAILCPFLTRLWARYTTALRERPLQTKMVQSGVLFISADLIAQIGIEGKSLCKTGLDDGEEVYDISRVGRMTFYGTVVFAPLAHLWLNRLEKVKLSNRLTTTLAKVCLDVSIWGPFVAFMFPTALGLLEGRSFNEISEKVAMLWFPTWQKAVCVFAPTQILNFAVVPPQHRLLVLQSVGMCWNIFLSWQNNENNKLLAAATAKLEKARAHAMQVEAENVDGDEHIRDVEMVSKDIEEAEESVRRAEEERTKTKREGGEMGIGVRMSWS
ncbi:hypothetical protein L204_102683 [Cryptococcus depauperatus]|nr:hypothetical protein L204_00565 [Cryptococcus depauperatus CBS 7855]